MLYLNFFKNFKNSLEFVKRGKKNYRKKKIK